MTKVKASIWIARPAEDVFNYVADPENVALWAGPVLEAKKTSPGPTGVGTTSTRKSQLLGRTMESNYEITAFEPGQLYGDKTTSGPVNIEARIKFDEDNGGTDVTIEGDIEAGSFFKLAEPVMARVVGRQPETDAQTLKDLLEA
jgi:uncharacterized protein YndB with AHSA1/START domain